MGFNRTFMELKLSLTISSSRFTNRFNRTFMELKLSGEGAGRCYEYGLIVPLWN